MGNFPHFLCVQPGNALGSGVGRLGLPGLSGSLVGDSAVNAKTDPIPLRIVRLSMAGPTAAVLPAGTGCGRGALLSGRSSVHAGGICAWRCECGAVTYGPALTAGCRILVGPAVVNNPECRLVEVVAQNLGTAGVAQL
jgi:hypothetical protein